MLQLELLLEPAKLKVVPVNYIEPPKVDGLSTSTIHFWHSLTPLGGPRGGGPKGGGLFFYERGTPIWILCIHNVAGEGLRAEGCGM